MENIRFVTLPNLMYRGSDRFEYFEKRLRSLHRQSIENNETIVTGMQEVDIEIVNDIPEHIVKDIAELYMKGNLNTLERIGKGGYGYVYGYDDYAIKYIYDTSSHASNDVSVLKDISHLDSIPTLYAIIDERVLIVERVKGKTVGDYVSNMYGNPFMVDDNTLKQWDDALIDIMLSGYSPYDLHEHNAMIDTKGNIKIVDVGFFKPHHMNVTEENTYVLKDNDVGYSCAQDWAGRMLRDYVKREKARLMAV